MESINDLKAKIQGHAEAINKSKKARETQEPALVATRELLVEATEKTRLAGEAYRQATLLNLVGHGQDAARANLKAAQDKEEDLNDRINLLESALSQKDDLDHHNSEIERLQKEIWKLIGAEEFASVKAPVLVALKRAYAAASLEGVPFASFREFISVRMMFESPTPDERSQLQEELRRKYKV